MRKVLINTRIGGYSLSNDAIREYLKAKNIKFIEQKDDIFEGNIFFMGAEDPEICLSFDIIYSLPRDDATMIEVVEKLGLDKASGDHCELKIIEIPDDVKWGIDISDQGPEWVYEEHRTWE